MGLFDLFKKKEEEPVTVVDPEIEKLREEKFNIPVIEDEEEDPAPKVEAITPKPYQNMNLGKNNSPAQSQQTPYSIYKTREIISPMMGKTEEAVEEVVVKPKSSKKKVNYTEDDAIYPVFSPYFGHAANGPKKEAAQPKEEVKTEAKPATKAAKVAEKGNEQAAEKAPVLPTESLAESVVDNKIESNKIESKSAEVKQEAEEKKAVKKEAAPKAKKNKKDSKKEADSKIEAAIVEQATGEFQLDFPEEKSNDGKLIEEIGDEMTLDELLSLYENRRK